MTMVFTITTGQMAAIMEPMMILTNHIGPYCI